MTTSAKTISISLPASQYVHLAAVGRQQGKAPEQLVKEAVGEKYVDFSTRTEKQRALETILRLDLPVSAWQQMEAEIREAHKAGGIGVVG